MGPTTDEGPATPPAPSVSGATDEHAVESLLTETREALRESEERFRAIFEQAAVGISLADASQRIVSANHTFCQMLGYPESELVRLHVADITPPETRTTVHGQNVQLLAGAVRSRTVEKSYRRKDGSLFWARSTISALRDAAGHPCHLLAVVEDISERKQAEEALRESRAQLEQASKMEAVGRLAGGVAHDFNNLLAVIMAFATLIDSDLPAAAPMRQDVGEILSAARRAAELTKQLLAFSRKQILQPQSVCLCETVQTATTMLARTIGEDVRLEVVLDPEPWPVFADPGQLLSVLMNLAVNARDAMQDGGILRIRTQRATLSAQQGQSTGGLTPGDYMCLIVEDTGVGIASHVLPHIFEPFFTTKDAGHGTGLGLATVYGIVKQSGGHVSVESTPGEGTRFTVWLPRAHEAIAQGPTATANTVPPGGSETLLLVEDEPSVRYAVRRMLEARGYLIREAAGVADASRVLEEHGNEIALVLTDVIMPGASGRVLGEQVAAHHPSVPVLYMSGYMDDEILRRGLGTPGVTLLEKPFTTERLASAIRRALDSKT